MQEGKQSRFYSKLALFRPPSSYFGSLIIERESTVHCRTYHNDLKQNIAKELESNTGNLASDDIL
jgi:hypothetical protein